MSVEEIVSVFNPASRQTEWDHFSKAQQKLVFLLPSSYIIASTSTYVAVCSFSKELSIYVIAHQAL